MVSEYGDAFGAFLAVLPGLGNGQLGPYATIPVGYDPYDVELGDFDGDGKLDLAVANAGSNEVTLRMH